MKQKYRKGTDYAGNIDFYPQGDRKLLDLIMYLTYINKKKITLSPE